MKINVLFLTLTHSRKHLPPPKEAASSMKEYSATLCINASHFGGLFLLPPAAHCIIKERVDALATILATSHDSLLSLAKRSLRSVMNPGGWLTIRPIMALNIPGNRMMHVKLKYGSSIQTSKPVDGQVCPSWTDVSDMGNLSSYTKIVRLCPRYVLVNMLERPIRLWQDSSTLRPSFSDFGESSFIFNHSFESKSASSPYANLLGARSVLIDRDKVMPPGMLAHRSAL